jgi:1,4-dihydroxy-2-naphthoate octaprenyltransferase
MSEASPALGQAERASPEISIPLLRRWLDALYTIPRADLRTVDPVTRWLVLTRAPVLVMTAVSALIGGLLAARDDAFDPVLVVLAALGVVIAHAASNLVNDFWDFQRGADTPDSPRVTYGPHAFASDVVPRRSVLFVTLGLLGAATAGGGYLTVARGPAVLAFALAGALVLLLYSGGPLPLKYFGLGEASVLLVWGPLMIGGTYYVSAGELPWWVVVASLPYAFGVTSVVMGKHLDKLEFDSRRRIRTLPVALGGASARRATQALLVAMYASTFALAVWQRMPGLLLVAGALPLLRLSLRAYGEPKPLAPPEGYPGWPLWFVAFAFIHVRRFGGLFLCGLVLQLAVEAVF